MVRNVEGSKKIVMLNLFVMTMLCLSMAVKTLGAQAEDTKALVMRAQVTPPEYFAGIVPSPAEQERLDQIYQRHQTAVDAAADSKGNLDKKTEAELINLNHKEQRSVLTSDQRLVYDANVQTIIAWSRLAGATNQLTLRRDIRDSLDAIRDRHNAVIDSLWRNKIVVTAQQVQQRWEMERQEIRNLLTVDEHRQLDSVLPAFKISAGTAKGSSAADHQ